MRFYQVHMTHEAGTSVGYRWFTNRREAESHAANWRKTSPGDVIDQQAEIKPVEIEPTRTGILDALRRFANHPDNG